MYPDIKLGNVSLHANKANYKCVFNLFHAIYNYVVL